MLCKLKNAVEVWVLDLNSPHIKVSSACARLQSFVLTSRAYRPPKMAADMSWSA